MDIDGAERILACVGKESVPSDIDKAALIRALDLCAEWYREAKRDTNDKADSQRIRRLSAISKTARRLDQLLVEDDQQKFYAWDSIRAHVAREGYDASEAITKIIKAVEHALRTQDKLAVSNQAYQTNLRKWSPFEWLVGRWLPLVYIELNFHDPGGLKALVAQNSSFVRFVTAVLKELDITTDQKPYSRQSIVKAVKLPFSGKLRRKGAAVAGDDYWWWRRQLLIKAIHPEGG
jgi:hypothetical protein